jgi:cytochrome c biogenesis protein
MRKFIKLFADLKFAILLLLLIAFCSSLGSVIEQDKEINFYIQNYPRVFFGHPLWSYFSFFNLTNIYTSKWFLLLLIIFGLCLLSCTISQQFPALKFARRYYFYTSSKQLNKLKTKFFINRKNQAKLCYYLTQEEYIVFQKQSLFYGYKGLIGRISPIFVHLSIILILCGSMLGATQGFNAQEFVPKSEIFHIQNIVKRGNLANISAKAFRINNFWINYSKNDSPKQFHTDISILTGKGYEIARKTISVNNPFQFFGLTMYQTDWGITGLRMNNSKSLVIKQLPVYSILNSINKLWVSWLPLNFLETKGFFIFLSNSRGRIEIYNEKMVYLESLYVGQTGLINKLFKISIFEIIFSSGIQIKADPGLIIIYTGFTFLIISCFVSYISFSEIWFLANKSLINFGGQTNRAKIKFQIQLGKIEKLF